MSEAVDLIQRGIAALWDDAASLGTDKDVAAARLADLVEALGEVEAQVAGLRLHLLHEARLAGADDVITQVKHSVRTTTAQATAAMKLSLRLGEEFPLIAGALNEGTISLPQADAIVTGLRKLPARVTRSEMVTCQKSMLEHTDLLGPTELRELASRLMEIIDPEQAERDEARRLADDDRIAHRDRYLNLSPDHHGSIRITGQLPLADAAQLSAQLEALMPPTSSYASTGEIPSRGARRADALVLLTQAAANAGTLPAHGGDRPAVHITVNYDTLIDGLGRTGLFGAETLNGISPGEARRLACDAHLIPMVLGSDSQPLDVGRTQRFFTPAIRAAITERDKACTFPSCTTSAASSAAHHIIPWWAGGHSSKDNGVLLCPHHHRLVEPDPMQSQESQWQVHLHPGTGLPWFTPPRYVDPRRRPRQHARFTLQQLRPKKPKGELCPREAPDPSSESDTPRLSLTFDIKEPSGWDERNVRAAETWGTAPYRDPTA